MVKSTYCSYRQSGYGSKHTYDRQLQSRGSTPSSDLRAPGTLMAYTYKQNTNMQNKSKNKKVKKKQTNQIAKRLN